MGKVVTLIGKEWAEVFKNRLVLFTVAFLPLVFVILPVVTMVGMSRAASGTAVNDGTMANAAQLCQGLDELECMQASMLDIFTSLFMILPVMIPVTIAAYSIVGEKVTHSLEPLLATPISTVELLLGKGLAAIVPAVAATWFGYGAYVISMYFVVSPAAFSRLFDAFWVIGIFAVGPMLAILAVCLAIMVSSRVSDPRVAEQLAGVMVLPLILLVGGQAVGLSIVNVRFLILSIIVLVVADIALIYLAVKTFQRETILTRWK